MISVIIPTLNGEDRKAGAKRITLSKPCKGASMKNTLVAGDDENDICCIRKAGIGVSFCSTNQFVDSAADYITKEPDFNLLQPILN